MLALPKPKHALPWEINANAYRHMTDDEARFLILHRGSAVHPAAEIEKLPLEVSQEIRRLIDENRELKFQVLLFSLSWLIFALSSFMKGAFNNDATGWAITGGVFACIIAVIMIPAFIAQWRKNHRECQTQPDVRFRRHWELETWLDMTCRKGK